MTNQKNVKIELPRTVSVAEIIEFAKKQGCRIKILPTGTFSFEPVNQ